jgi:hypothetical protein
VPGTPGRADGGLNMPRRTIPPHLLGYLDPFGERQRRSSYWVDPNNTRTKGEYPYSYSEFYLYGGPAGRDASDEANYSDRLWQWDYNKTETLWKKHCEGHRYDNVPMAKLTAFMSEWHGRKVEVTALAEGCNPSNGYPYWIIWFRNVKEKS